MLATADDVNRYLAQGGNFPAAVIVDFEQPEAERALAIFAAEKTRPVIIGIAAAGTRVPDEETVDSAFVRPVDPARLFTRVVTLLADRKKGGGRHARRLTGIVAVVRGNTLFHKVERELHQAVPPVNAGAILEKALRDLGADPLTLAEVDLAAMLASGRLEQALLSFGEPTAIRTTLARIGGLLQ